MDGNEAEPTKPAFILCKRASQENRRTMATCMHRPCRIELPAEILTHTCVELSDEAAFPRLSSEPSTIVSIAE
jgi:hypothetical protein